MAKIISRFASTMSASQRAQVAQLLKEGEDGGKYATQQAFLDDLTRLSAELQAINAPLFTFFYVLGGELVDNGRLNHEIRMMRLDMQTVFTELDALQDAVLGHRDLMEEHIIDVRNALSALDSNISTLELLADESNYNLAIVNSFNMLGATGLSRAHPVASDLYYDSRKGSPLGPSYDLLIDVHQEGLALPTLSKTNSTIVGIQLYEGADSTPSDLNVDPDDNSLFNITAEGDGLYWVRSILRLDEDAFQNPISPPVDGAKLSLRLDLGGYRSINSLTLVPYTDTQFDLAQILYLSTDGLWYSLLSDSFTLLERAVIYFEKIDTREIILQFTQKSYTELIDFSYADAPETTTTIFDLIDQATAYGVSFGSGPQTVYSKGYLYTIGFDFISVDLSTFEHKGVYVSREVTTDKAVAEVALKSTIVQSESSTGLVMDAIEFTLSKYNYNEDDALVYVETIPIFPTSKTIEKEVLVTDASGFAKTRFYPVLSTVQVYRDHTLLTLDTDYDFSVDGGNVYGPAPATAPVGPPIRLHVRLNDYLSASSYTVSYTVATAHPTLTGEPVWLNDLRTVRVGDNGLLFEYLPNLDVVSYSKMYLKVIARSTDLLTTRNTPIISDYSLLVRESDAI